MSWKLMGYIAVGLILVALTVGVGVKLTQKTEGYKASGDQFFISPEPRFGCATAKVYFYGGQIDKNTSVPITDTP